MSVGFSLFALPLGCSADDDEPMRPGAGSGGSSSAAGGSGGSSSAAGGSGGAAEMSAGQGGALDGAANPNAAAHAENCASICATEAQLSCAKAMADCLKAWCDDPITYFPQCLGPYDAMLACVAPEPLASFKCDEGAPFPNDDLCAAEQVVLDTCLAG